MRQPQPLASVQIVVEDAPLLRLTLGDGHCVDYGPLRRSAVLLLAKQALAALVETDGGSQ
jgi:hypothetical protein